MNKSNLKFHCFKSESGECFKEAWFHGYDFGERALEGVWLKAVINFDGTLSVEWPEKEKDNAYLKTLNKNHWLQRAREYAEENDLFAQRAGGALNLELIPFSCHRMKETVAPRPIKMTSAAEFAAKLSANPQIPTGADYHIAKAKSALQQFRKARFVDLDAVHDCFDEILKALELIQAERENEKDH